MEARPRLYRSGTDRMVAGVCGGLAQYLNVDATFVRLFFVVLALLSAAGPALLIYFIMWIVVPREELGEADSEQTMRSGAEEIAATARNLGQELRGGLSTSSSPASLIVGGGLVVLGLIFLVNSLHLVWFRWVNFDLLWPLLLILAGVVLIQRRARAA